MDDLSVKLTISHLRLVIAIAEEHSLVGAAKRLNMTQPAVTKALRVAEGLLGVALFDRTSAGIVPTIYGEALVAQARTVVAQLSHAAQSISDLRDGRIGRIAVGTLSGPSAVLLPATIIALRKERPNIVVNVIEGTNATLVQALRRGDIELIIGRLGEGVDRNVLRQEELFTDVVSIVARPDHPLVGRRGLKLADLVACDWILPPEDTSLRRQIDHAFQLEGLEAPPMAVEARSLHLMQSLVLQSDYLTVWPWEVVGWEVAAKRLGVVPILLSSTASPVGITTRADFSLSPAAIRFVEMLRETVDDLHRKFDLTAYYR